jgi:molybdate transport system substrate-binding protein
LNRDNNEGGTMTKRSAAILMMLLVLGCNVPAQGAEVLVAAAADLNFAIKEIASDYEKKTGNSVKLSLGSSGNFHSQISNGAPFDLFFSADIDYPRKLDEAGLTVPGTLFMYALGRIVIWVPKGSAIGVEELKIKALLHSSVQKVAIANPEHAPYGRAAVAALKHFGIYEQVQKKFVLGENISQTAQFVQSGAADIGIIAISLAVAPTVKQTGRFWEIPPDTYPRIEQGAVILKAAQAKGNLEAVRSFYSWVKAPVGQAILRRYGFVLPNEFDKAAEK